MAMTVLTDPDATVLAVGAVRLDCGARVLAGPGGAVTLCPGAFSVLQPLFRRPGTTVTMAQLIEVFWPDPAGEPSQPECAVRMRVVRARAALTRVGAPPKMLRLVLQLGYRLVKPAPGPGALVTRTMTAADAAQFDAFLASPRPAATPLPQGRR